MRNCLDRMVTQISAPPWGRFRAGSHRVLPMQGGREAAASIRAHAEPRGRKNDCPPDDEQGLADLCHIPVTHHVRDHDRTGVGGPGADHHRLHHGPDGPRRLRECQFAFGFRRPHRAAECGRGRQRPQARPPRHRRPDEPDRDHDRGAECDLQGCVRHRLAEPALLRSGQVPPAGGNPGDRLLLGRARVGRAALHEHVRLGQRERRSRSTRSTH